MHQNQPQTAALPAAFFTANRAKLTERIRGDYLTLLAAGRPPRKTADENYPFFANRNFFYLCGVEQESAVLLLSQCGGTRRDILFIPAPDAMYERWTGRRITLEEARAQSGLDEVAYLDSLDGILGDLLSGQPATPAWLDLKAPGVQAEEIRAKILASRQEETVSDLSPLLARLRMIKDPEEIARIEAAIAITGRGIAAMLRQARPGLMEYHLWAEFQAALAREGCLEPAFPSIVAAGDNIFCLHYMRPTAPIRDGDLIQIDVGASYGGLCADISRAFPANGRFSPEQTSVYQVVRACQEAAFATIRPGIQLKDVNEACREVARQGLTDLGVMNSADNIGDYFWHNVSHHLGMDVHDHAEREAVLEEGMVLTVEPGVYIPSRHVGLRIEDNVVVTADGCRNLSAALIREVAEIESVMR